jgi:hypothetical protein
VNAIIDSLQPKKTSLEDRFLEVFGVSAQDVDYSIPAPPYCRTLACQILGEKAVKEIESIGDLQALQDLQDLQDLENMLNM